MREATYLAALADQVVAELKRVGRFEYIVEGSELDAPLWTKDAPGG